MTQNDLELIKRINEELICLRMEYNTLAENIAVSQAAPDGMPYTKTNKIGTPTENKGIKLAECTENLRKKEAALRRAKNKLTREVEKENDVLIQKIIKYRCILMLSWEKISQAFDGVYSANYLRQIYFRYKSKLPKK